MISHDAQTIDVRYTTTALHDIGESRVRHSIGLTLLNKLVGGLRWAASILLQDRSVAMFRLALKVDDIAKVHAGFARHAINRISLAPAVPLMRLTNSNAIGTSRVT